MFSLLLAFSLLAINPPVLPYGDTHKIAFQNAILCKVHGTTISMLDVKKKMDLLFYQNYPQLADSNQARFQFYEMSWRQMLSEMIDHELMLADAEEKEVKLTDGEVREELEARFGPNVSSTLDQIGLTYEEAWKMVKNDLLVRRMSWWFIHAKALQKVTPQVIRQAYRAYLKENPPYKEWKYQVIAIRGDSPEEKAREVFQFLSEQNPENLGEALADPSIQISKEYSAKDTELSEVHRNILATLQPGTYSAPVIQVSRVDKQPVARIFYLAEAIDHPAPQFEEICTVLQNELNQKAVAEESQTYFGKLRKHYGVDTSALLETLPSDFQPFSLN